MPTIFTSDGFRFFFFSNESNEPVHVHVEKAGNVAKFWLKPVKLARNEGFRQKDLKSLLVILFENQTMIEEKWNEYFNS